MKIHPGPQDIRYRLVTFAEHAQPQGLKIVAAFAAEHASLQTDGLKDRAIVDAADHRRPSREARYRT
ncbi:MAG TPA: hypothetical protein VK446_08755 [Methylocystis sp.]|nr:hypothetical protein [Methylocystis sp.]